MAEAGDLVVIVSLDARQVARIFEEAGRLLEQLLSREQMITISTAPKHGKSFISRAAREAHAEAQRELARIDRNAGVGMRSMIELEHLRRGGKPDDLPPA